MQTQLKTETATQFVEMLWAGKPDDLYGSITVLQKVSDKDTRVHSFWVQSATEIPWDEVPNGTDTGLYIGVGFVDAPQRRTDRPNEQEMFGICGLWADIDMAKPDSKKRYPPTLEDVKTLLAELRFTPSVLVATGGGVHAWWLFREALVFGNDLERSEAKQLSQAWQLKIASLARRHGWEIDMTANLDRILRVVGGVNYRYGEPRDVEIIEANTVRYRPEDFAAALEEFEAEVSDVAVGKSEIDTSDWKFDFTNAEPPAMKFAQLMKDPGFVATFNETRTDMKDTSPSAYSLALAIAAAKADWTDQEIINLLIAHRRHRGHKQKTHLAYFKWTIQAARETAAKLQVQQRVSAWAELQPEEITPDVREKIRTDVSNALGVTITRVIKYVGAEPQYYLETPRGATCLGRVSGLIDHRSLRDSVAELTNRLINPIAKDDWPPIAQALLYLVEEEDAGEQATEKGEAQALIRAFLRSYPLIDGNKDSALNDAADGELPFHKDDRIYLFGARFQEWLRIHAVPTGRMGMGIKLRKAGANPVDVWYVRPVTKKRTKRQGWILDEEFSHELQEDLVDTMSSGSDDAADQEIPF